MPESSDLKNVKDVLSSMGECASDLKQKLWGNQSEEIQTVARSVVEGIGHAHWAATGLLIVAVVLERFETISYNQELCLDLLQEMWMLCNYIKKLRKVPQPTPELEDLLNKSLNLTVEGALMCCLQREAPRLTKFMNASSQRQRLNKLKTELNKTYTHLLLLIVISGVKTESQISRQETYPTDADYQNRFKDIKGINIRWSRQDASVAEVVRRSRFKLTATQLSVMAPSLRIFSADADMETGVLNVLHAIIIKDDLCSSSAEFKNLLFWQSKGRSIAFDLKQAPKLKFLRYAPACTVDMCQVPTSVEDLSIDLSGIPNEDVAIRFSMDQGTVPKVKRLVIAGLRASKMPQGVLTRLNSLTYLCIHNCDFLSELESHDFEHLINMVRLQLSNCKALRRLPQNLKKGSPNLRHLHVTYCPSLVDIPLNFQQLTSLVTVFITDCSQVTQLPHSMGECASLQILGLKNCSKLRELPRNFHLLSLLKVLSLRGCTSLESLPLHFGRLGSLEVLRLTSCTGLKHLSNDFNELPLQSQLNLSKCMALESHCIDMLVHMKSLQTVFIEETPQLIQRWQEIKHNAAEAVTQPVFITGLAEPATSQK